MGIGRRQIRLDQPPFVIGQIGLVTQHIAAMLPPGGWGPHGASQVGFDNRLRIMPRLIPQPLCEALGVLRTVRRGDRMRRREFIALLGSAVIARPVAARAQQRAKRPRIGVLGLTPPIYSTNQAFRQGLGQFNDADNLIERDAAGRPERLPELAAELVQLNVDVIFARGPAALAAAKNATSIIPIVAVDFESDPVALGFVKSLAQPGGNITGVFLDLPELSGKQVELLKEAFPQISRIAILGDPVLNAPQFRATDLAAQAFAIQSESLEVRVVADFDIAFDAAKRGHAEAIVLLSSPLVFSHKAQIGALGLSKRLPVISLFVELAEAGGFMAYGPSLPESFQRCGRYVEKILQGAKPGELPIERPERFQLVINFKTAKMLGLTIPPLLLARADEVIE
jgi:putative ABC transport system substrate-binding protein